MEDIVVARREGGKVGRWYNEVMIFDDDGCLIISRTSCFLLLKNTRKEEFLHKN